MDPAAVAWAAVHALRGDTGRAARALCELAVRDGFAFAQIHAGSGRTAKCLGAAGEASGGVPGRPALERALRSGRGSAGRDWAVIPVYPSGVPGGALVIGLAPSSPGFDRAAWMLPLLASMLERRARDAAELRARVEGAREAQSWRRFEKGLQTLRHDLKSPLVPLRGYVEMVLRGMAGEPSVAMRRFLERCREAVDRMRALIDERVRLHVREPADLRAFASEQLSRMPMRRTALAAPDEPCLAAAEARIVRLAVRKLVSAISGATPRAAVIAVTLESSSGFWRLSVQGDRAVPQRALRSAGALFRRAGGELLTVPRGATAVLPRDLAREKEQAAGRGAPSPRPAIHAAPPRA